MCSIDRAAAGGPLPAADTAARIGRILDQLAATARQDDAAPGFAQQLAEAWAVIAAADPDLAARAARYTDL